MKIFFRLLVSLLLPAVSLRAQPSSNPRIAVIDVQAVLTTSTAGKAAYDKLNKFQDDRLAQAKAMTDKPGQLEKAPRATGAAEEQRQKQIADQRAAIQRYSQSADREIGEARDRELAALEVRIKPVIDALATEMGLDVIFNKFESGLVFASPRIDITEAVVKRFNLQNP